MDKNQIDELDLSVLMCYRNRYYTEGDNTERGIVANAINNILPVLVSLKNGDFCKQNVTPTNTPIEEMSAEIQEAVNGCSSYWSGLIAEHLHEQGYRKQSEWISVEDRLPEENGQYLACVCLSCVAFENLTTIDVVSYGKNHGFYLLNETEKVTHWMPLPGFPKMKGGE